MMANPKNQFDNFMEVWVDELIAMPDDQVLEGADANAVKAKALELLSAAKVDAGRRRLAAAKAGFEAARTHRSAVTKQTVSAVEARRYIAQAQNDIRYTLAARNLVELSDEEALRLYSQMKSLEAADGKDGESK